MFPVLQASKYADTCITNFSNSTNNCDVQIVGTICFYTTIIVAVIATAFVIIKLLPLVYSSSEHKDTKVDSQNDDKKLTPVEKERIAFYDFCFAMAKSTKPEEKELAKECWEILKSKFGQNILDKTDQ